VNEPKYGIQLSIIVPVFNGGKNVETFLKDFRKISDTRIELIIVDGGSSDQTLVVLDNNKDIIKKIIEGPDEGLYDAMNKGVLESNGDYLLFMGIDDRLVVNNIPKILSELDAKDLRLLVVPVLKESAMVISPDTSGPLPIIHHQGAVFNRIALISTGFYRLDYLIHSDFDLIQKYIKENGYRYREVPLVVFTLGGLSTSGRSVIQSIKELSLIYCHHSKKIVTIQLLTLIARPIYYFAAHRIRELFRL
tara:strand:+ start:11254 stop:12000 length:747 start_codon:yes stop_codon:yes gene_type:complete